VILIDIGVYDGLANYWLRVERKAR
jgi:hypothetical protein